MILDLSANGGEVKDSVEQAVNAFATRGFRALGLARADGDGAWQLLAYRVFDPTDVPLLTRKSATMNTRIAKRAYELYERRGRHDGRADQAGCRRSVKFAKRSPTNEPARTAQRVLTKA